MLNGQLLCNGGEEFFDILGRLCRRLKEEKTGLVGVCLGVVDRDCTFVGLFGDEIEFISGEGDDDVLVCLTLKLLDPGFCFIEGSLYGENKMVRNSSV